VYTNYEPYNSSETHVHENDDAIMTKLRSARCLAVSGHKIRAFLITVTIPFSGMTEA